MIGLRHHFMFVLMCLSLGGGCSSYDQFSYKSDGAAEDTEFKFEYESKTAKTEPKEPAEKMPGEEPFTPTSHESLVAEDHAKNIQNAANDIQPIAARKLPERIVNRLRIWKDNQGLYSTSAELLSVEGGKRDVKLLKENGKTITVPFARLSEHDQNYVNEFISAELQSTSRHLED